MGFQLSHIEPIHKLRTGDITMDVLGRIAAIILTIIALIFMPIMTQAQSQSTISDNLVNTRDQKFTNDIRTTRKITWDDYQNFCDYINKTGNLYDVTLQIHERKVFTDDTDEREDEYFETSYHGEVLDQLFDEGTILLHQGDMISIIVSLKSESYIESVKRIFPSYIENSVKYTYGGEVR